MKDPMISIIIPVRNAERTLEKTFEYLFGVDYPRDRMEIVIADGGSTDKTVEIIKTWQKKYPFIKLVDVPNCPSPGYARNKALDVVQGEYLFFTDGDCAPTKNWIHEILKHFRQDPEIGIVGGEIKTIRVEKDNLVEAFCEYFGFNNVSWRYGGIGEGYFPPMSDKSPTQICGHRAYFMVTANVAFRRVAVERAKARFWDLPTGEDIEFGLKIKKDGWKAFFAPQASVEHMHRATDVALYKVWASYSKGHLALLDKYATNHFELVFQFLKSCPRIKFPSPIKGFIYFGNFQMMHIFGLIAVITLINLIIGLFASTATLVAAGWFMITLLLFVFFAYRFFYWCFCWEPKSNLLYWFKIKYLSNWHFMRGVWQGMSKFKYRIFCIEPSF